MVERRVVITGIGLITPLGAGVEPTWQALLAGQSGIGPIENFDTSDLSCKVAGYVPRVDGRGGGAPGEAGAFDPDSVLSTRDQRRVDEFILYGIAAADEAIKAAGWTPEDEESRERTGVMIGSGIGGLKTTYDASLTIHEKGARRLSPFVVPSMLINLASGQVSMRYGFKGPNHSVVSACSTGANAIGDSAYVIMRGDADVMIAGGAEASICRLGIGCFAASRALSTANNDNPEKASRPWDKDRDGFVMGEGAGVFVLEELEHALARGANIIAEVSGYGLSGDAYHITAPAPDGNGGYRSMKMAMKHAGLEPKDIDYVNAHGTSTPMGDEIELRAVERMFGDEVENIVMSSTKSSIGHLLGAAGAVEAAFCALAIRDGICPPTLNLDNPSMETKINLAPHKAVKKTVRAALSNSFGFGGTNASLVLTAYP
ncbi:MAG: beta-ketoacyl-[acyl-carrier-protein] synthase II [Robiginitomaculum sp.]|nr:MAG: beta-ketoacyl-[acyl-carrier-protein] synthase II [Robiginitomaculum sp.]